MKKILVPVDFSAHTETVCKYAIEIAKKSGGELRLFHAYFDFLIAPNSSFTYTVDTNDMYNREMMTKIKDEAFADMQKLEARLIDEIDGDKIKNVKVVYTLTGGLPEDEILNIAEIYAPDLIVMGTKGKGEKDFLTGKISTKVVQNATCRILTVPREASYHGFANIVYATDFDEGDTEDLQILIDLVSNYKPIIHCIHVNINNENDADESELEELKSHFIKESNDGSIIFDMLTGDDFLDCLNQYVDEHKIDMIAIVHRRKSFLKRLFNKDHTRQLLFHSNLPLYIFPGR